MIYATKDDLADYQGIDTSAVSAKADSYLQRASIIVDSITLGYIDTDNTEHLEAAKTAVCAQVDYWLENGTDTSSNIKQYTAGKISVVYADQQGTTGKISDIALSVLFSAGLLYRGVSSA